MSSCTLLAFVSIRLAIRKWHEIDEVSPASLETVTGATLGRHKKKRQKETIRNKDHEGDQIKIRLAFGRYDRRERKRQRCHVY